MQIAHIEITPVELRLHHPYRAAHHVDHAIEHIPVIFVRIETRQGEVAWGCAAFEPQRTGETLEQVLRACHACADRAKDLSPLNLEYALDALVGITAGTPSAQCAFDMAFHDLLGLATRQPLYRLLGGFRDRIQTSVTVNVGTVNEAVAVARERARQGFRILKLKGGIDPHEDVARVRAVRAALPHHTLRLDADGGYTIQEALEVARALEDVLEMLEQPVPAADGVTALREVTERSPVPVWADESVRHPAAALEIAGRHAAHGLSLSLASCGGLRCARQIEAIARAARLATMVGCINEPALLASAGLAFALSSPGVTYGDLDGHFDLADDPSQPRFTLHEGWLIASESPGLGCTVEL